MRMERMPPNGRKNISSIKHPLLRRRFALITLMILVCCSGALYVGFNTSPTEPKTSKYQTKLQGHEKSSSMTSQQKTILYWNGLFSRLDFGLGEGHVSKHCPPDSNNCYATSNRHLNHIDSYNAILFHGINEEFSEDDLPTKRSLHQKYVFVALESPANRHVSARFNGFFNATATYQWDSDILWTYSDVVPTAASASSDEVSAKDEMMVKKIVRNKSRAAAWYASNCKTPARREEYVVELEKYISVDKFGSCYEWWPSCPKNKDCFRDEIEPKYFFYLAFENSLCQDYVTEKFFKALQYYVVPVVYGGANYTKIAPPQSYIDARDFDTPQHLALYLLSLTKNLTKYEEYFSWKRHYQIISTKKRIICDLCRLTNANETKSYNISTWYSSNRCKHGFR